VVTQSACSLAQIKDYIFEWNVVKSAALSGNLSVGLSRFSESNAGQMIALLNGGAHNVVSRESSLSSYLQQYSFQNSGSASN